MHLCLKAGGTKTFACLYHRPFLSCKLCLATSLSWSAYSLYAAESSSEGAGSSSSVVSATGCSTVASLGLLCSAALRCRLGGGGGDQGLVFLRSLELVLCANSVRAAAIVSADNVAVKAASTISVAVSLAVPVKLPTPELSMLPCRALLKGSAALSLPGLCSQV